MKSATVSIGTPNLTNVNHVPATSGVAPKSITQAPLEISTYPSMNIPMISEISYSLFASKTLDKVAYDAWPYGFILLNFSNESFLFFNQLLSPGLRSVFVSNTTIPRWLSEWFVWAVAAIPIAYLPETNACLIPDIVVCFNILTTEL